MRNQLWWWLAFLLLANNIFGQACELEINGNISDASSGEPLSFATIYLEEHKTGTTADEAGNFVLTNLCPGAYHLLLRHVGCEPEQIFIRLTADTTLSLQLEHHAELIDEVIVHGSAAENTAQNSSTISEEAILKGGDGNLGRLLNNINGVSSLSNGAGISKPIVHGLFGNRITILNNGVVQGGQQWGNDHAPEIDPFVADHLSVLKGVSALQYGGSSLGSVVLVEPDKIEDEPHLHGRLSYLFASNGRGHTINTRLERSSQFVNWRFTGTLRQQGDTQTPDYFLRNTGRKEANAALQLEKKLNNEWDAHLYLSYFNTSIGVMRGSHIGNLTDLANAVTRDVPFFTENSFSYRIEAPRQAVQHSLLKLQLKRLADDESKLTFTYAGQLNNRKEFDVRRGNRTKKPALSLQQWTHFIETDYSRPLGGFSILKGGLQTTFIANVNQPGTGISPLIPDYNSVNPGVYASLKRERERLFSELGIRYDFTALRVATVSSSIPREIIRYEPNFSQFSAAAGLRYQLNKELQLGANLGSTRRAPAVNELYSSGLHQGVSGIEEGDINLQPELSIKGTLSLKYAINHWLFVQALTYYQRIQDYIYLQVQPNFRLTIRGAFPLYVYEQTDAELAGLDLMFSLEPNEHLKLVTQYSYLKGTDVKNDQPLVLMPPNRLSSSLEYAFEDGKRLSNTSISVKGEYTFKQNRLNDDQDLLATPDAYFLLSSELGTHWQIGTQSLHFNLRVDNILNTRYRDYLNRLRYFADELGRNVVLGINWEF